MVIIDTSAWVEFFRRDGDPRVKMAVKGLLDAFEGALCGPVVMEFLGGAREHERRKIEAWFALVPYVRTDHKLWKKAAENFAKLRAAGFSVAWNDILIATITIESGLQVYARDKHFPQMSETLGVHLYRPGYNGMFNPES